MENNTETASENLKTEIKLKVFSDISKLFRDLLYQETWICHCANAQQKFLGNTVGRYGFDASTSG